MSQAINPKKFPEFLVDEFKQGILSSYNARYIAKRIQKTGSFSACFAVDESTAYNLTFVHQHLARTLKDRKKTLYTGGGGNLFFAIERIGCFSFGDKADIHPDYLAEKMGHSFGGETGKNIADFLNEMRNLM